MRSPPHGAIARRLAWGEAIGRRPGFEVGEHRELGDGGGRRMAGGVAFPRARTARVSGCHGTFSLRARHAGAVLQPFIPGASCRTLHRRSRMGDSLAFPSTRG